jgi:hypothetical protein
MVEFSQVAEPDCNWPDFQDLRVNISWDEVKSLASCVKWERGKDTVYPSRLEDYHRLLVFCAARPGTSKKNSYELGMIVQHLNGYDLSYWALQFKRAFWYYYNQGGDSLSRTAASFRTLFGLT